MANNNYSKKCECCGGNRWVYKKDLKLWECMYCGAQVERKEEYDGLYTIKNVVRQVILDSAYRRMEQADRNLSECQKINARYAGTLVAGICFRLIAAVSPEEYQGETPQTLLGQLKRDYRALTEESRDMSDDETAVYEFLDSSDAWAVLAMVFDTLGDEQRRNYLLDMLEPGQVFSKETNKSLLRYAMKNNRMDLAQQVLENHDNVDIEDAVHTVLETAPDGPQKAQMASGLIADGALKQGEEEAAEEYLSGSDSVQTKAEICQACCQAGLELSLDVMLREVMGAADPEILRGLLENLFSRRLYDSEIEQLLGFAGAQNDETRCLMVLQAMNNSGQFVPLNSYGAQQFMNNSAFSTDGRVRILEQLKKFTVADHTWETVAGGYLCQSREEPEVRMTILESLLQDVSSVRAKDFEDYVMRYTGDGEKKPEIIKMILCLSDMNAGFFRDLTGNYLKAGKEPDEIKSLVIHQLLDSGLSIEGNDLVDYICTSSDDAGSKVELAQLAVRNGTNIRSDALSIYLENCASDFKPELFALLYTDASKVTNKALENYVLRCGDSPAVKAKNAYTLASHTGVKLGSSGCRIRYQGNDLECTLGQAYLLTTEDDIGSASAMIEAMTSGGTKLNTEVRVNGIGKRFNKFAVEFRDKMSPVTQQLCEDNKLFSFSLFF